MKFYLIIIRKIYVFMYHVLGVLFVIMTIYLLSCLASSSFGHSKRKCISSSTVNLHSLQILWSAEMLKYLPCSISKLWELILNFVINH
jgi:hypothetical protein